MNPRSSGFSLVETLVVIAVIAILATLALPSITGAKRSSEMVVARQQQTQLQQALDAWIVANSSGNLTLADARSAYAGRADKLSLVQPYLRGAGTTFSGSGSRISSDALNAIGKTLLFSSWDSTNQPIVGMSD